ncbi:MAG: TonB family protein [Rhodobacterales bacterium]|uniref:TonB family protein n=1 Tax=Puniceibacterium antarcticum TaxID=1206336 RepID=UPI0015D4C64F|nr:TonB family protein [Puniceibacterium antarcticum]
MKQYIEFLVFTLVAVGVLMLGFSVSPPEDAAASAGVGGEDLVTMEASSASVETMVEEWLKPPDVSEPADMPEITQEVPDMTPPTMTAPRDASKRPTAPAMSLPQAPSLPDAALAELPPPPPEPESSEPEIAPESSERPQLRPERPVQQQPEPAPRKEIAKTASKASADSAGQRAAGTGGGAQAGQARSGQSATSSAAEQNSLKASWGAAIRTRVERRKRYPSRAGRASGTVELWLKVTSSGALAGVGVSRSSGNSLLDQAAVSAVQNASMPAAPRGLTPGTHAFSLPIRFSR